MPVTRHDLRALGFASPDAAATAFDALPGGRQMWARLVGQSDDPDLALIQLQRLAEADPNLVNDIAADAGRRAARLTALLGGSRWWGDYLIANTERVPYVWVEPGPARDELLRAVGADPTAANPIAAVGASSDDMRRAYRRVLIDVVADDLTSPDPVAHMSEAAARLADLADAALEAALSLARRDIDPTGSVRLAIIAMGKTGAGELNYISDVDVLYVAAPRDPQQTSEQETVEIATRLAAMTAQACSGAGSEPPLWTVDANLRPEGRNGVLVRTLESYAAYWEKWAQTWEFQALLKARPAAGDRELGAQFTHAVAPFVWNAVSRAGFVDDTRGMRLRVEKSIPRRDAQRELKLGRGGLRDVEFSIQLLQLVHGRTDESVRVRDTVGAISALTAGGYVSRAHAAELTQCYRFLRCVEHRAQLPRMRRTHLVPTGDAELRAMARSVGVASTTELIAELDRVRARVRSLHEDIFYRPIVAAIARLSADEAALDRDAAKDRLAAIGYLDPEGALGHITALTAGTSRRATIQRNLLPVFISWLAKGANPDMGLLNFRALSEQIGDSHWYLALLRDSGVAASRLCTVLPNSRWIADALCALPEAVEMLDDDARLQPREAPRLAAEVMALVGRHADPASAAGRVRSVRNREVTRSALADALGGVEACRQSLAQATDAALEGMLVIAEREEAAARGGLHARVGLVAVGRYGGLESSYASDADVLAVHRAVNGASENQATACAIGIIQRVRALMGGSGVGPGLAVDLDLRPEGRSGVMSRTVESYREYYQRWASAWERQALLRARPAAGDLAVLEDFIAVVDPVRYHSVPTEADIRDIRLLKARMENERLPRGTQPARHVKLGPGGLSDVEWVVQLLQLRNAHDLPALRVTSTFAALSALETEGLVGREQSEVLREAWSLASRIRAGNVLSTGRMSGVKLDVLPHEARDLVPLARLMGYRPGEESLLEEDWLRAARHCRTVMDELFWGQQA